MSSPSTTPSRFISSLDRLFSQILGTSLIGYCDGALTEYPNHNGPKNKHNRGLQIDCTIVNLVRRYTRRHPTHTRKSDCESSKAQALTKPIIPIVLSPARLYLFNIQLLQTCLSQSRLIWHTSHRPFPYRRLNSTKRAQSRLRCLLP